MDYICEKAPQVFVSYEPDSQIIVIGWSVISNRRLLAAIYCDANACTAGQDRQCVHCGTGFYEHDGLIKSSIRM